MRWLSLTAIGVLVAVACASSGPPPTASPRPIPSPTAVGSPGTGGTCGDPVPAGLTCVTGTTQAPSRAAVGGVCVKIGEAPSCSFSTDAQGGWRAALPNGIRFILTFSSYGQERARIDLTPSFLSGGTKEWPTPIVIE